MAEQKKRKALIVYASVTGNTEKVALRFKQVIEKRGRPWGDWECEIYKITKHTDRKNPPVHVENYDLFCVGAPIWSGIPPLYLFDDHLGALMPIIMPRRAPGEQPRMPQYEGWGPKKGIVFVTYGGEREGTHEAWPAIDCLEMF